MLRILALAFVLVWGCIWLESEGAPRWVAASISTSIAALAAIAGNLDSISTSLKEKNDA
jgi:hypothetical protein